MVSHDDIGLRIRNVKPMTALSRRDDITILALVGNRRGTVYRRLLKLRAQLALAGIELTIGELGGLPAYGKEIDDADLSDSVAALRVTAAKADAALIIKPVYGSNRGALRNAIDWLTWPRNGELQDKPLAVVVPAVGGFVGVWSHPANPDAPYIVEKIAVAELGDLVQQLAAEVDRAPMIFEAVHSTAD
jgi:NADPH-dependent FMN reductase